MSFRNWSRGRPLAINNDTVLVVVASLSKALAPRFRRGHFHSVDEVIVHGVYALREKFSAPTVTSARFSSSLAEQRIITRTLGTPVVRPLSVIKHPSVKDSAEEEWISLLHFCCTHRSTVKPMRFLGDSGGGSLRLSISSARMFITDAC